MHHTLHPLYNGPEADERLGAFTDQVAASHTILQLYQFGSEAQHAARMLAFAQAPHGGTVLSLGCGVAGMEALWQRARPDLDFELVNLGEAQHVRSRCVGRHVVADAETYESDRHFDVVIVAAMLGHVDVQRVVAHAIRHLKRRGVLLIAEPFDSSPAFDAQFLYTSPKLHHVVDQLAGAGLLITVQTGLDPIALMRDIPDLARQTNPAVIVATRDVRKSLLDQKVALQFSGGRDSLAMIVRMMEESVMDRLTVYHLNTGDQYPETARLVKQIRDAVPNFVEVAGRAREVRASLGTPTDILDAGGQWVFGPSQIANHMRLVDRYTCCYLSIAAPLHQRMKEDGVTLIMRGQRASDDPKSHVSNGSVVDGIQIRYPIEQWTDRDVIDAIRRSPFEMPPMYIADAPAAFDCMECSAWLEYSTEYRERVYPEVHARVQEKLRAIRVHVAPVWERLKSVTGD